MRAALAASKAKSEFLSSMSHEIRTPMNAILGTADLLSETPLNSDQSRYVGTLVSNGNALLELINSVLDLARMESGRLSLEATAFELVEVVEKTIETLAVRADEKQLELALRFAPEVPTRLVGDPLRLRQVVTNLVGNAIKFTDAGEVAIRVERDPAVGKPGAPEVQRLRYRHRHRRGQARQYLLGLHPGRFFHHPEIRWQRTRPHDRRAAGRTDGRPRMGRERARQRQHIFLHRCLRPRPDPR